MNEFIQKISSYNLFNYLLPGALFVLLADKVTTYSFIQGDLIVGLFLYYFIGLVVSRMGSIIIEPFLKWTGFLKFSEYHDFVLASKKDPKIEILSEQNNMMRTFCSLFLFLFVLNVYSVIKFYYPIFEEIEIHLFLILLLVIFLFSYKKQTEYITKRVKVNI